MRKNLFFFKTQALSFVVVLFLLQFFSCSTKDKIRVENLMTEYLRDPLGIDCPYPRFTWNLNSEQRSVYQQAYQIIISSSKKELKNNVGNIWDSGRVLSGNTVNIEYAGIPLETNRIYYWRIRVWTDKDREILSDPAIFHTGILDDLEWEAKWITTKEEIINESPLFRKEFVLNKNVSQAFAFVTARGFYEFYLNGEKVGDEVLAPSITDYRKTVLYSTYDVSSLIKKGENVAGAMLGNGAWNQRKGEGRWNWSDENKTLGNPGFLMQLMINYNDGSKELIITDDSWKYTGGPVTFNDLFGGEDYDARKEINGWKSTGFNDSAWEQAVIATESSGRLKSQMMPPLRVCQTITPVKNINPEPGVYIFDLGQNIAGWWRLEVKGSPGQRIRIRPDETLNDQIFPKDLEDGDILSTKYRYHTETWTDYTIRGSDTEIYEPHFFYTGFRYLEVTSSDKQNPIELKVEGRVVRTALERNGIFHSSDTLINKIHLAGLWSQMGNCHSYPTDCPHREKGAYNGDGQVIAETSMHDFHIASLYTKWLNDMRDAQEENGRIPNTSPTLVGGMGGGVAWGSAYILIPWWMHNYYMDLRILKEHYPTMKKYLMYLKDLASQDSNPEEDYIINDFLSYWYSLGEWCAPGQSDCPDHSVVNTFYYYYNSLLMSKIAGLLGYTEDESYFAALSDTIKSEFNKKFFNPSTALYGTEEIFQTYQILALTGDLVPESYSEKVFRTIVDDIKERDNHLNTGIIGTKYLWPVLVKGGEHELAYKIATQTSYPSYGYWISNNSTTLLEEWDGNHSHNHQMFGSVVEYFYKYLAGIQSPMEGKTDKGYKNIRIEPYVPENLEALNSSLETISGIVHSSWERKENSFSHRVEIPANTSGIIALPVFDLSNPRVWEGNSIVWENHKFQPGVDGILNAEREGDRIMFSLQSGKYFFKLN